MNTERDRDQRRVMLVSRRPRPQRNYSMEASFERLLEAFPDDRGFHLESFVSSYFSAGVVPRLRALSEVRRLRADVFHITGDVHFLAFGLPGENTILTIHDSVFMYKTRGMKRWLLRKVWLDGPVARVRFVTTVSTASKRDVIRFTGCDPDKVVVVPTVISAAFQPRPRTFERARARALHIGLGANKNFERHVTALAGLGCELLIVGRLEPHHVALLERHGVPYQARHDLSTAEVVDAYASVDVVLFASTFEGFGMPIVEGQSVGRPVITSNLSSMPEVAGTGACLVDPHDVGSIRTGLERILDDACYRESLVASGFENAARFSAARVAAQYADLYDRACA
ncbi:MAG: glycosyltransferase family 4 protein [Gammaproteobacteria bacterium]